MATERGTGEQPKPLLDELSGLFTLSGLENVVNRFVDRGFTLRVVPKRPVGVHGLDNGSLEVHDKVVEALQLSKEWYDTHDDTDGTALMYAVDVINQLRLIYKLPES